MVSLSVGDRVTVSGTETIYEGRSGELTDMRADGVYSYGVQIDGLEPHNGRRWFSLGELKEEDS